MSVLAAANLVESLWSCYKPLVGALYRLGSQFGVHQNVPGIVSMICSLLGLTTKPNSCLILASGSASFAVVELMAFN